MSKNDCRDDPDNPPFGYFLVQDGATQRGDEYWSGDLRAWVRNDDNAGQPWFHFPAVIRKEPPKK